MRNDDAKDLREWMNHAHPAEPDIASEDARLAAESGPEHDALVALASVWSERIPSAERLASFARQLPSQAETPRGATLTVTIPERVRRRARREAEAISGRQRIGSGRLLAGLLAAVVVVGLLTATLLRLAPGRTAQREQGTPTAIPASATATPQAARIAEEPTSEPPAGTWMAVAAHAMLIPAPSDGNVVYQTDGAVARVSQDGGVTWRTLTIPTFTQKVVTSDEVHLIVSDADAQVVLLSMTLMVNTADPAGCPPDSKPPAPMQMADMHGGVLASGTPYCIANFASHDGGTTWSAMTLPSDVTDPPDALDPESVWQLGETLYGLNTVIAGISVLHGSSLLVSHDLGVTWSYARSTSPEASSDLCSFLPSASDGALYAITSARPCFGDTHAAGTYTVWRSIDGGASWNQVASLTSSVMLLVAASPATDGHGVWLYAQKPYTSLSSPPYFWVSEDQGATWRQAPDLPQVSGVSVSALNGVLADGSMVVAAIEPPGANLYSAPTKGSFYAWRPGDAGWRQLTTALTANYAFYSSRLSLSRGGPQALDTLWVLEANGRGSAQPYTMHRSGIK